jgi:hypothetical protein
MRDILIAVAVVVTVRVVAQVTVNAIARKCFETQRPDAR